MEFKTLGRENVDIPAVGMGTWNIVPPDSHTSPDSDDRQVVRALKYGIELGLTHIDTSEGYGDGRAEKLVAQVINLSNRDRLFIASKVDPPHFHHEGMLKALEGSLKRLGTDYLDLYMLHRPNDRVPLEETMGAMEELVNKGLVRFIGVSNFSVEELKRAQKALSANKIVANQVKYNVLDRDIENDLLPYAESEGITITAYSPFETGRLFELHSSGTSQVELLAAKYEKTPAQIYLNWLISKRKVITIPKAIQISHLNENAVAGGWRMETADYQIIAEAFSRQVNNQ